jgi:hypothetical protein
MKEINRIGSGPAVHCNVFDYCSGKQSKKDQCWEVARSNCDFQYVFNVCSDCIVYLYGHDNANMSKKDIELILQKRSPVQEH